MIPVPAVEIAIDQNLGGGLYSHMEEGEDLPRAPLVRLDYKPRSAEPPENQRAKKRECHLVEVVAQVPVTVAFSILLKVSIPDVAGAFAVRVHRTRDIFHHTLSGLPNTEISCKGRVPRRQRAVLACCISSLGGALLFAHPPANRHPNPDGQGGIC